MKAFLGYIWCVTRVFIKSPSGRKRFNVLAALNAINHQVITVTNDTYITGQQVCELLQKLYDLGLTIPITLVLDNARYQKCRVVLELAESLGILQQVVLKQIEGVENIEFDQKDSFAFIEASGQKEKLGITLSKSSTQPQTIIATFDKPVSANQTITIALKPFYNPTGEGIYLFRVHVISFGEKTNNLVVGTARLQFYNDFDNHLFYQR